MSKRINLINLMPADRDMIIVALRNLATWYWSGTWDDLVKFLSEHGGQHVIDPMLKLEAEIKKLIERLEAPTHPFVAIPDNRGYCALCGLARASKEHS